MAHKSQRLAVTLLALAVLACGGQGEPLVAPVPTATSLATEALTNTPRATHPASTGGPKVTPAGFYAPPGWDAVSDVNCKDFDTHAHALSFFRGTGGSTTNDPYGLDGDHDGNPCETLP